MQPERHSYEDDPKTVTYRKSIVRLPRLNLMNVYCLCLKNVNVM